MSVIDKIRHYQRNVEKYNDNEDRILHCIYKLFNLPVTVQHLQETGVGRTINALRKYDGYVGNAAKAIIYKWKTMVAEEYTSGEDEETCVSDVPKDSHSDSHISPKLESTEQKASSMSDQMSEKHTHKQKESKSESLKSSTMHSSKPKAEEEKHERHERIRHSSKHHSKSDKSKESRSGDNSKAEKTDISTRKISDKITEVNKENNKKRKPEISDVSKKIIKKRRLSDSDDEKSQLPVPRKSDSRLKSSNVLIKKVKTKSETVDKEKQNIKREMEEKSKSSSFSKLSSKESSSKAKESSEKQKHKKDKYSSHRKSNMKKDTSQYKSELSKSKASTSGSKDYDKSKDKNQKKERKDEKATDKKKKETKIRLMQEITGDEGIDCNSGTSFAEALGMCTVPQPSKKRHSISSNLSTNKPIKTEPTSPPINNKKVTIKTEPECDDSPKSLSLLASNVKLEPLSVDLVSTLPEISPNYKPLSSINPVHRKEEVKRIEEFIYVKNQRTKVYSGNKVGYTSVPTLYDMCIRILIENIDALEFTGGVPFDILKPILDHATADQLFMLEHYNPYLIADTDALWQFHCNRNFNTSVKQETESWREMYVRCLDEREAKLKALTANIKQTINKCLPVRSKLAYVDVKPPRNVLRKQAKYGTANVIPTSVSSVKRRLGIDGGANNATNIVVPSPPMSRFKASTSKAKKTKAPLMAKALQLIKKRYKR